MGFEAEDVDWECWAEADYIRGVFHGCAEAVGRHHAVGKVLG